MKRLVIGLAIIAATSTAFAKLPKATDKSQTTIHTNNFEYSRRGTLGAMDWVLTEVTPTNLIQKGVNSWAETDESDGDVDGIYGYGVSFKKDGGITVTDPVTKEQVASCYYFTDEGHSFVSIEKDEITKEKFTYYGQCRNRIASNVPFCYGTNVTASTTQIFYPDEVASANDTVLTYTNAAQTVTGKVHSDRTWVIRILKAYRDGKLTINDDGSIIIAE